MRITIVSRDESRCYRGGSRHVQVLQVLRVVETVRQRRCCGFAPQSAVCNMRVQNRAEFSMKAFKVWIRRSESMRMMEKVLSKQ